MNKQQRRATTRTREQLRRQAEGPSLPQGLLIGEPGPARVVALHLFFRNDRNNDRPDSEGFALQMFARGGADLWPDVEHAATLAQANLDRLAAEGHSLSAVLDGLETALSKMSPRIRIGVDADRRDAGMALVGLLTLRSFGRADDCDEFNGITFMGTGCVLRTLPVLRWHGATTSGGRA